MFNGSKSCEVTAIGIGNVTITGTLKYGTSATMNVIVTEKVEDIAVGTKHIEDNYEYSYGQRYFNGWETIASQKGWGVKVTNNTKTDYESSLTMIQGKPVTNISLLFYNNQATTLNLIDWDTSNVTNMEDMFSSGPVTILDLNSLDASNFCQKRVAILEKI